MTLKIIGSRLKEDLPKIQVKWTRGKDSINWLKAVIFLILGKRGSGKSALVEALGMHYPKIIDLFGSRDNENLAWCRDSSPIDDILLVHGDNVDLKSSWETCNVGKFTFKKMMEYEAVVTCNSFYTSQDARFSSIHKIINEFWHRFSWKKPIFVAIREASSFLYSRIKLEGVNMKQAKADFIYFQREMRHFGYSLGVDTIRWTSVDKEMRDLADYLIIKKVGAQGLPYDIRWLYKFVDPMSMASLPPDKFMMLTDNAAIGYGRSELPKFHKEEGADLIKELGIVMEYGEEIEESTLQRVGDEEHIKIVSLYNVNRSMETVSKTVHRSLSTISRHIKKHNQSIGSYGACAICKRARGDLFDYELIVA